MSPRALPVARLNSPETPNIGGMVSLAGVGLSGHDNAVSELTSETKYYAVVTPQGEFLSTKTYVSEDEAKTFIRQNLALGNSPPNKYKTIPVWVSIRDAR